MKTLVIYDSQFGNTEQVARAVGEALGDAAKVLHAGDAAPQQLQGLQALIVGSPTQRFRPTPPITTFLKSLPAGSLKGVRVAAFDTRLTVEEIEAHSVLAFFVRIFGYAAKDIGRLLARKGGRLVLPPEGFYVEGMEGPLMDGEIERAQSWAKRIMGVASLT